MQAESSSDSNWEDELNEYKKPISSKELPNHLPYQNDWPRTLLISTPFRSIIIKVQHVRPIKSYYGSINPFSHEWLERIKFPEVRDAATTNEP